MRKIIASLVYRCINCHSCEVACAREHEDGVSRILVRNIDGRYSVPASCRHCHNAACFNACHTKAIKRDNEEFHTVVTALCDACKLCVMHCPLGLPKLNLSAHSVALCDFCAHRQEEGKQPACVETCPAGALTYDDFDSLVEKAVTSRCTAATCPAGINVPRYVRAVSQGKHAEALAVIREANPLPSVCGRVCSAPCESGCRQGKQNEPIAINMLKRFVTDIETEPPAEKVNVDSTGKRVAIIGSGPAGLTAAYFLAKTGHQVTIFESLPEPGGMLRVGIPEYHLPKEILNRDIERIVSLEVEIRVNTRIESFDQLLEQGYNAILVATGAHKPSSIGIEGEDTPRVIDSVTLLRDVALGKSVSLGDKVLILGSIKSTIDVARTARRLGAKEVTIACSNDSSETSTKLQAALDEGIKIEYLVTPTKITGDDSKVSVELTRIEMGTDDSGNTQLEPVSGSEFTTDVDFVISAIGRSPDIPDGYGLDVKKGNIIGVDESLATSKEGIFAAGDAVIGPASVIQAIAQGKEAASSIDKYLGGSGVLQTEAAPPESPLTQMELVERLNNERMRPIMPCIPPEERVSSFSEVETGLTEEMAIEEGKRCLRCDVFQ